MRRSVFYLPITPLIFILFIPLVFFIWIVVSATGVLLGFTFIQTVLIFLAILVGSTVNIPVKKVEGRERVTLSFVKVFGIPYPVPQTERSETVIAVNLGGAVIPVSVSFYLMFSSGLSVIVAALLTAALTTFVTNLAAKPVKGVGIVVPTILPGLVSALGAVVAVPVFGLGTDLVPQVAFIGGVLGAIIGADLLNLTDIQELGAPVVSIGGAGTFDGILVTGVTAVLLGAILIGL